MFAQGPITIKDIYKLDPFGNEVIVYKLTADEIKSLIINAYIDADNSIDLQVSGMTYLIKRDENGNIKDVELTIPGGKKKRKHKTFNTAINSYIASSYRFDHTDPGKSLYITTAQVLIDFITKKKEVDYKGIQRAFIFNTIN